MPTSTGTRKSFINSKDFGLLKETNVKVDRLWCTKCGKEVLKPEDHVCSADERLQHTRSLN